MIMQYHSLKGCRGRFPHRPEPVVAPEDRRRTLARVGEDPFLDPEAAVEGRDGIVERERKSSIQKDVPGIDTRVYSHDGQGELFLAVDEDPIERGRTAILGQLPRVQVETAHLRDSDELFRDDLGKPGQ